MTATLAEDGTAVFSGSKLRWHRRAASLDIAALAEKAGVSRAAVSLLENGHRRHPRVATVQALADALGCQVTDLMPAEPTGAAA